MARFVWCHKCPKFGAPEDMIYIDGKWYCDEHAIESFRKPENQDETINESQIVDTDLPF